MITAQKGKRYSYDYAGASYYLEGLVGGIPYQQKQICRLQEDLQILRDEMYSTYHSPSLTAWADGTFQKNRYDNGHNKVLDMMEKETRIEAKIAAIEATMQPVMDWINSLDSEAADIVKERYWRNRSLDKIGYDHAMSRETVRRLLSKVLLDLENKLFNA